MVKKLLSITVLFLITGCDAFEPTYADVTLVNDTSEVISSATLSVALRDYSFVDLQPGDGRTVSFLTAGDDSYSVHVVFASGREIKQEGIGYVGEGMPSSDTIRVLDTSLKLEAATRPDSQPPLPLTP